MTFSIDMTVLGIVALIAGIAAFFAPRFLGFVVAIGLVIFGAVQLFPEIAGTELGRAISRIDLNNIHTDDSTHPAPETEARGPA